MQNVWRTQKMSEILTMNKDLVDASGRPISVPTIEDVQPENIPIEERGNISTKGKPGFTISSLYELTQANAANISSTIKTFKLFCEAISGTTDTMPIGMGQNATFVR